MGDELKLTKTTDAPGFQTGSSVYYKLTPEDTPFKPRVFSSGKSIYLPLAENNTPSINYSFSHNYNESDITAKKGLAALVNASGPIGKFLGDGMLQEVAGTTASVALGGGLYLSGSSMYNDSSPNTLQVQSYLLTMGDPKFINLIEDIRYETSCSLDDGASFKSTSTLIRGGLMRMPCWWTVEVINGNGNIISHMPHMQCDKADFILRAPFHTTNVPHLIQIMLSFKCAYRGYAQMGHLGNKANRRKETLNVGERVQSGINSIRSTLGI
jgi:hypothetical protein